MIDFRATLGTVLSSLRSIMSIRSDTGEPEIVQECPHCGFQGTNDAYDYCPRDGSRLQER